MCRTTRTAICHSRRRRICSGASRRRGTSNCAVMVVSICMYGVFFFICWFVAGTRWCGHCVLTVLTVSARSGSIRTPAHARCTSRSATRRCEEQHCRTAPHRAAPHRMTPVMSAASVCVTVAAAAAARRSFDGEQHERVSLERCVALRMLRSRLPQCCLCCATGRRRRT